MSPVYRHFNAALEALGEISTASGVAAMWLNAHHSEVRR